MRRPVLWSIVVASTLTAALFIAGAALAHSPAPPVALEATAQLGPGLADDTAALIDIELTTREPLPEDTKLVARATEGVELGQETYALTGLSPGHDLSLQLEVLSVPAVPDGKHEIALFVLHQDADGTWEVLGDRNLYLVSDGKGPIAFHVGHLPIPDGPLPLVHVEGTGEKAPDGPQPELGAGPRAGSPTLTSDHTFQVNMCVEFPFMPPLDDPANDPPVTEWQPLPFYKYEVRDANTFGSSVLDEGNAGKDGCFLSDPMLIDEEGVLTGDVDPFVRVKPCNPALCVRDQTGLLPHGPVSLAADAYEFDTPERRPGSGIVGWGTFRPTPEGHRPLRAYAAATAAAWMAADARDGSLEDLQPRVWVQVPCTTQSWHPSSGAWYNRGTGFHARPDIHLCADNADRSPDLIGHEYAHHLMDLLYGGDYWPSPNGDHTYCGRFDRGLAWAEGFADFYGPYMSYVLGQPGEDFPGVDGNVRDGRYPAKGFSVESAGCRGAPQGDDIEFNVARTLWDMAWEPTERDDAFSFSVGSILNIMDSCQDHTFRDFHDGAGQAPRSPSCNWSDKDDRRCALVNSAFQNGIDYNTRPTLEYMVPEAGSWHSDEVSIWFKVEDEECDVDKVVLSINEGFWCDPATRITPLFEAEIQADTVYKYDLDTTTLPDRSMLFVCAYAHDGIEAGQTVPRWIRVDNTPPTANLVVDGQEDPPTWIINPVSVEVRCSDAMSGPASREFRAFGQTDIDWMDASDGLTLVLNHGFHGFDARCHDVAGNRGGDSLDIRVDTVPPETAVTTIGSRGDNGWYLEPVEVRLSCQDVGSGCATSSYILDTTGPKAYTGPIGISDEGKHWFVRWSTDNAGLVEVARGLPINIDLTPPTLGYELDGLPGHEGWFVGPVTLEVNCDDIASDTTTIQVRRDGTWSEYTGTLLFPDDGVHEVRLECSDPAGRTVTEDVTFRIDSEAPSTTQAIVNATLGDDGWYETPVTVQLTCDDGPTPPTRSGCERTIYEVDGKWLLYTGPFVVDAPGIHEVCAYSTDVAGNTAEIACETFLAHADTQRWSFTAQPHPVLNTGNEGPFFYEMVPGTYDPPDGATTQVTLHAGLCEVWAASAPASTDLQMAAGTWVGNVFAPAIPVDTTLDVSIGFDGHFFGGWPVTGGAPFPPGAIVADGPAFDIPTNGHLTIKLCNPTDDAVSLFTDGRTWLRATEGSPTYPGGS